MSKKNQLEQGTFNEKGEYVPSQGQSVNSQMNTPFKRGKSRVKDDDENLLDDIIEESEDPEEDD